MATVSDTVRVLISARDLGLGRTISGISMRLRRMAVAAQQVGMAFTAIGGILATGLYGVIKSTVSVDDALRKVAAKAEVAFDGDVMKGMIEKVQELGRETPYTTKQVADLFTMLAQKNWSPEMMNQMAEGVLKFASASDVELPEAADAIASVMEMFGDPMDKSIEKMTHFSNVLAKAQTGSQLDLSSIMEGLKQIGGFSDYAGQSLEAVTAQLMIVSRLKLEGSRAGRAGRAAYIQMFSKESKVELDRWRVSLRRTTGGIKKMSTIVIELQKAFKREGILGKDEQLLHFKEIFGKVGNQFITSIAKSAGEVDALEKQLMSLHGTVERMYRVMEGGLGGTFRNLKSAFMSAILAIGDGMKSYLGAAAGGLIKRLQELEMWFSANPDFGLHVLAAAAGSVAAGLAAIGVAMGAIVASTLFSALAALVGLVTSLGLLTIPLAIGIAALAEDLYNSAGGANMAANAWNYLTLVSERLSKALSDMMMLFAHGETEAGMKRVSLEFKRMLGDMASAMIPLEKAIRNSAMGQLLGLGFNTALEGGMNYMNYFRLAGAGIQDEIDMQTLSGRYAHLEKKAWEKSQDPDDEFGAFHGEKWWNEYKNTQTEAMREIDEWIGQDKALEDMGFKSFEETLKSIANEGEGANRVIEEQTQRVKDLEEAHRLSKIAGEISEETQKKLEDLQYSKLSKKYADLERKEFDARMRAEEIKKQAEMDKYKNLGKRIAGIDWKRWWKTNTDPDNPFMDYSWAEDAKKAKKTIESITYGKLGDFDANTAAGKMNAKLNSMAEKQLKELERQSQLLGEISNKMTDGGGLQIA